MLDSSDTNDSPTLEATNIKKDLSIMSNASQKSVHFEGAERFHTSSQRQDKFTPTRKALAIQCPPLPYFIALTGAFSIGLLAACQVAAFVIWPDCSPYAITCRHEKSRYEMFKDFTRVNVPPLRKYTDSGQADFSKLGARLFEPRAMRDCVSPWVDWLRHNLTALGTNLTSDPARINSILTRMDLNHLSVVRAQMGSLLTHPQSYAQTLEHVTSCAMDNLPLHQTLCGWLDDPTIAPNLDGRFSNVSGQPDTFTPLATP